MNTSLTETLDAALERLQTGEPLPDILARYPAHAAELRPLLSATMALEPLRRVPTPAPEALAADREAFLSQIPSPAVSFGLLARLQGWIAHRLPRPSSEITQPREKRKMLPLLLKATLIFSLIFGSAGGVAVLSADSLPGSPLYPAKLAVEQVRLNLASDPAEQAALQLELAQTRVQEVARLAQAGEVPGEATLNRLQTHLERGLALTAQAPETTMLDWLAQAQQMAQREHETLLQAGAQANAPVEQALHRARMMLQQFEGEARAGLQDPHTFRWRHTHNRPPEAPPQPTPQPEPPSDPPGPGAPGGNPDAPCEGSDCEPDGEQHQHGPQPEQPGPGAPSDNPDAPCEGGDCGPGGGQQQNGPQPNPPDPGNPGGNSDAPCQGGDCESDGEQNQNGSQPNSPGGEGQQGGGP